MISRARMMIELRDRARRVLDRLLGADDPFRVHIVCYEDVDQWILGKFALKLAEHLSRAGVHVDISKRPDPRADINHHIIYINYDGRPSTTDTIMVTHIDTDAKRDQLAKQLAVAQMGVCMSRDTAETLARQGLPRERLCFINPAHDGTVKPRRLSLGITSKVQPSGCKREQMLLALSSKVRPDDFEFRIMGSGWDAIVETLRRRGFDVQYIDQFDRKRYIAMLPALDYYLYFGEDEGSMGFIDALAAGIPTIVTPQGYHLDAAGGITHAFSTDDELAAICTQIAAERRARIDSVAGWTWAEYARKHLVLWRWLAARANGERADHGDHADLDAMGVVRG